MVELGDVRRQLGNAKLFGVKEVAPWSNDREVVIQIEAEETPYGPRYEYRRVRAVGSLFIDGEFKIVIGAGDVF